MKFDAPVRVTVRETSSALDGCLRALAEEFCRRLETTRRPYAVSIGALGLRDALGVDAHGPDVAEAVPIRLTRGSAILGPVRRGAGGPCSRCLERRWQAVRPPRERQVIEASGSARVLAAPPALTAFAIEALWSLVCAVTEPGEGRPADRVYELRFDDLAVHTATLLPDAECPGCANPRPDRAEDAIVTLRPRTKRAVDTYRLRASSEIDIPLDALVNPICGAVSGAAVYDDSNAAMAVVAGVGHFRSTSGLHEEWWGGHTTRFATSERVGVVEGLERLASHGSRAKAVTVYDTYDNLKPDALDPTGFGYGPSYYADHDAGSTPVLSDLPMHWVWGYSLRDERPLLVPEQLVYYVDHRPDQRRFVRESTNGCASGSCQEEAILFAMLELVERDAFLLTWYASARQPEIDASSVRSLATHVVLDRLGLAGYDTRLFDVRVDLPVPAVVAVLVRREPGLGHLCFAGAARMDPEEAVRAAVWEAASIAPGLARWTGEHLAEARPLVDDFRRVVKLEHHVWLHSLPQMADRASFLLTDPPVRSMVDLYESWLRRRPATFDLCDDVRYIVDLIAQTGSDVIAVDVTSPEQAALGLHSARVLAPGLVPLDFGWRRQRVLTHPRLRALLGGVLPGGEVREVDSRAPTRLNLCPHPLP